MTSTTQSSTKGTSPERTNRSAGVARARGLTVVTATVTALALWVVLDPLFGLELAARSGGSIRRVGPGDVALAAVVGGLAGWALLAALGRVSSKARGIWTVVASVVLCLSLLGTLAGVTVPVAVALMALHLLVGVILIVGFRSTA